MKSDANPQEKSSTMTSRRSFLGRAAVAAAAVTVVPRHVLGGPGNTPPSEKLNIAGIGIGGMGGQQPGRLRRREHRRPCATWIPAFAAGTFAKYPQAKRYKDFRVMLDQQKDIDAVIVATPDHTHAVIAMAAIERGKHVYVQKPLAHAVWEARVLTEAARKHKVVSQMGNQGHSGDGARLICEWIGDGAIGAVREVHAWTNRPVWPQGIEVERPKETPPVPADAGLGPVDRSGPLSPLSSHVSSRTVGGPGGTSAPARWATWAATSSTRPSGP